MINITINNAKLQVEAGTTILDAARKAGFSIPTLCYLRGINEIGACRVCVVEVKGARNLVTACNTIVNEGMEITTNSPAALKARKTTLELILSDHDRKCTSCFRSTNCELQSLAREYGCEDSKFAGKQNMYEPDDSTCFIVRDNNKCILCRRCEAMCKNIQNVGVIGSAKRGFDTKITCAFDDGLNKTSCVACGQCINVCPTGALRERDDTDTVYKALNNKSKHVVAITAPAVRVGLGEEFGAEIGTFSEGKMVGALKAFGFKKVFDVNLAADLTIMEEGHELLERLNNKDATLPMITSCSPGWIRYIEYNYSELIPHLSSCKSPQQMFGAVIKTYYAEKFNIPPEDIFVVSIMPCTAKKYERTRQYQSASGFPDIDVVITTREFARMIRNSGILYENLPEATFDNPLGEGSTAGLIFGTTGGVMEAALRTVSELVCGQPLKSVEYTEVRGAEGLKVAEYTLRDTKVKVAVVNGIGGAKKVLEEIKRGESPYHFIEIMTCPGGCVNGGGQPIVSAEKRNFNNIATIRSGSIYKRDKNAQIRKSHENPVIKTLYSDYFGEPNSARAHKILHTKYFKQK